MFHSQIFNPLIKEAWHMFHSCATPLLLVIILVRANAYSRAFTMLRLSGTVLLRRTWKHTVLCEITVARQCSRDLLQGEGRLEIPCLYHFWHNNKPIKLIKIAYTIVTPYGLHVIRSAVISVSIHCIIQYSSVGTMVGGGRGPQRNQPKIIFRNHSQLLDSIGQA